MEASEYIGFSFNDGQGEKLTSVRIDSPGLYEVTIAPTNNGAPYLVPVVSSDSNQLDLGSNLTYSELPAD
ncbi:MAG: hypothetical protein SFY67_09340 [Candidatus Melainabacteria bacterium]|nr:hypothetical protein [Candidatus Melainabacteria bacterium]